MTQFDNAMRRQVYSLPELIRDQYRDLEPKTRSVLSFQEIFNIQRIVLTGCGDSHCAAMATKHTFEQLTGVQIEVVPALELSRFYPDKKLGFAPLNPLIIAVSNSGGVARVGEAIQRCVKKGAFALGVTGKRDSLLGKSVSRVLDLNVPKFESAPGIRSYLISVLTLLLLAIRIGEVRGKFTMDQAQLYRKDILKQADLLEHMLPEMDAKVEVVAEKWKGFDAFDFVGAGNDYAAAWFGHAKTFEACGKYAMCINAEEWLHLNFFMRNVSRIGTVVVCSDRNRALTRVHEMVEHASVDMGRPTMVVTDDPKAFAGLGADLIAVPKSDFDQSGALTNYVPNALLMGYIAAMIGEVYSRGCKDNWAFADHGNGINISQMVLD